MARQDQGTCRFLGPSDATPFVFSVIPFVKSGLSLVSLLLVASSAPLLRQLYLLNVIVSTTNRDGMSSGPSLQGGIGIWGACLEQSNFTGSSPLRLCTFASPLGLATLSSLPVPIPTLPSYLPPYFSPLLSFFFALALACALVQHALRSYILWGEISEYGRVSIGGKKEDPSDKIPSCQPDAYDGLNRFGGAKWRNMWETVSRELAVVSAQSCIIVIGILLFPLLPSIYILDNSTHSIHEGIMTSMLLIPGWGMALLFLSVVCTLTLRPSSFRSRSRSRSRSRRSTGGRCRPSGTLPSTEIEAHETHDGYIQGNRLGSSNRTNCIDTDLPNSLPPSYRSMNSLPRPITSTRRPESYSKETARLHSSFLDRGRVQIKESKKSPQAEGFWVPVLAFAEMSEGEADAPETAEQEEIQVIQVEFWA